MAKVRILISFNHKSLCALQILMLLIKLDTMSFSAAMNLEKLKLFRHYYVMVRL